MPRMRLRSVIRNCNMAARSSSPVSAGRSLLATTRTSSIIFAFSLSPSSSPPPLSSPLDCSSSLGALAAQEHGERAPAASDAPTFQAWARHLAASPTSQLSSGPEDAVRFLHHHLRNPPGRGVVERSCLGHCDCCSCLSHGTFLAATEARSPSVATGQVEIKVTPWNIYA